MGGVNIAPFSHEVVGNLLSVDDDMLSTSKVDLDQRSILVRPLCEAKSFRGR